MTSRLRSYLLPLSLLAFACFASHCGSSNDDAGNPPGGPSQPATGCIPKTCPALGKECGRWDDGCDDLVDCGGCATGLTCGADGQCGDSDGPDIIDPPVCVPDCTGRCCGDDGCGDTCPGACPDGYACDAAACRCVADGACDGDRDGDGCDVDCDDTDPRIGPSQSELCANGTDDNCDGHTDCADEACRDEPNCAACEPTEGLGDECSLSGNPCSCRNMCGQSLADDPQLITHYCYAECAPEQVACPGAYDACVPFDAQMTTFGCLPTGSVTMSWEAKVLPNGVQPNPWTDISLLTAPDARLAGTPIPLSMVVAMETGAGPDAFVSLGFQGLDGQAGFWQLEVSIPKASFASGRTLGFGAEGQDFYAVLIYATLSGQTIDRVYIMGMVSAGTVTVDTATEPGAAQKSSGSLDIDLLGLKAELEAPTGG